MSFFFRHRVGNINWPLVESTSLANTINSMDLDALQSLLDSLAFSEASYDGRRGRDGDDLFVKAYKILQLIVEYLLHVQAEVNREGGDLRRELLRAAEHVADLDERLRKSTDRNKTLKREVKMYQAIVRTCEGMLTHYGLDSTEIFLAARASSLHYGKSPSPPFTASPSGAASVSVDPSDKLNEIARQVQSVIRGVPEIKRRDREGIERELEDIRGRIEEVGRCLREGEPVGSRKGGQEKPEKEEEEEEQEALEEDELKQVVGSPPTLPDISPLDPPYVTARPSQPLQRGRFVLSCVSASGIRNDGSELRAYLKCKLGNEHISNDNVKARRTGTTKAAAAGGVVQFGNEKINFDVQDPTSLTDRDDRVFLEVSLYDDNWISDKCVCAAKIDVTDAITRPMFFGDGPKVLEVDMHKPGTSTDCGVLKVKVEFWAAKFGVVQLVCNGASNLNNVGNLLDKQDPYVYFTVGKEKSQTDTVQNGGVNPSFNSAELLVLVDESNWNKPAKVQVFDDDFGSDSLISEHALNLFHMMSERSAPYSSLPLQTKSGKEGGTLNCFCSFLPFGQLNVIVCSAKNLRNPDSWGKPDPYVQVTLTQGEPAALKALPAPVDMKSKDVKKILNEGKHKTAECSSKVTVAKQTQTIDGTLNPDWLAE